MKIKQKIEICELETLINWRQALYIKIEELSEKIDSVQIVTPLHMKCFGFELKTKGLYNVIYSRKISDILTAEVILDLTNPTEIFVELITKGLCESTIDRQGRYILNIDNFRDFLIDLKVI